MTKKQKLCTLAVALLVALAIAPQTAFADDATQVAGDNLAAQTQEETQMPSDNPAEPKTEKGENELTAAAIPEPTAEEEAEKLGETAQPAEQDELAYPVIEASAAEEQEGLPSANETAIATQAPPPLSEGAFSIKPQIAYGTALSCGATRNAAAIKIENIDGTYNQVFYFQSNGSGLFAIFSLYSGLALDASGSSVQQTSYSASSDQLFEIREVSGFLAIVSKSGRALIASGSTVKTGAYDKNAVAQQFRITEAPLVIPGVQVLFTAGSIQESMGVANSSRSEGAACKANTYAGEEGQKVTVARNGAGYEIRPLSSGMDFVPSGSSIIQKTTSFAWRVTFAQSGSRRGLVWLDPATNNAAQKSGTDVKMAALVANTAQAFLPARISAVVNGCYSVKNLGSGTVLEIAAGNWANGANVQMYASNGTGAQIFNIKNMGSGLCQIVNAMTGYAVSAADSNAYQYTFSGAYDQLWIPVASKGGGVAWINASTGRALNATGTSNGANASTISPNNSKLQSWTLVKTSYTSDPVLQTAMRHVTNSSSATDYQIMVDRNNCRTIVAEKSGGVWRPIYNWSCSPGAPATPTVGGSYTITGRGYSFSGALGGTPYTCYYYTQFWGDYLFHSIPYHQGTWNVQDGRLGQKLSHGCVRLATENAKWLYDNIPYGTYVYIYN